MDHVQQTRKMVHYSPYKFDEFELRWSDKIGAMVSYVGEIGPMEWFAAVSASPYSRNEYLEYGGYTHNGEDIVYMRELKWGVFEKLYATKLYRYTVECVPEDHDQLVHGVEYICRVPPKILACHDVGRPIRELIESAGVAVYGYGEVVIDADLIGDDSKIV